MSADARLQALSPAELARLNPALRRAQLAAARAELAAVAAREAERAFAQARTEIGAAHGVAFGDTHGWREDTGEIVALGRPVG